MNEFLLETPVVFVIFNRPEKTRIVFEEIKKARPRQLLLVSDGPRVNRAGEAERVAASRAILGDIDWHCDVLTEFSDVNLGCRNRLATGITWAFQQVSEAIILEDDCLPHPSFFRFCQELLDRYRDDQRVGMISGNNFQDSFRLNDDSYYFSNMAYIWGWASWRDRWMNDYDVNMKKWATFKAHHDLSEFWDDPRQQKDFLNFFELVSNPAQEFDTWDYQWLFANRLNGRVSVVPNVNLVSNIGFDADATHTQQSSPFANLPVDDIQFPLRHPVGIFANRFLDRRSYQMMYGRSLVERLRRRFVHFQRGRRGLSS